MRLIYQSTILDLSCPANYPAPTTSKVIQAKELSAGGVTHVETFLTGKKTTVYSFSELPGRDVNALVDFFINSVSAQEKTFDLIDDLGVTHNGVRFVGEEIKVELTGFDQYRVSFVIEEG